MAICSRLPWSLRRSVGGRLLQGGIDMDPVAFNAIDGNGAGVRDGHMNVYIEWV